MKTKRRNKVNKPKISKRLAAAAPSLLNASWSILLTCEEMELGDIEALNDVRDAIKRATGRPVRQKSR
jgi:hypothetical protein